MAGMDLTELILVAKNEAGSYERLAARVDHTPTAQRFQQIASGKDSRKNFLDPTTIRSIARACRVPLETVVKANARSLGLEIDDRAYSKLMDLMPHGTEKLTSEETAAVLSLVRLLLKRHSDTEQASTSTPATATAEQRPAAADTGTTTTPRRRSRAAADAPTPAVTGATTT